VTTASTIRVFLVDDHTLVRRALRGILESDPAIAVVGEATNGIAALGACRRAKPTIVVMDISLPGMNGIDAARNIVEALPDVGLVMLSMHASELYVRESLKAGAKSYVLKDDADRQLIAAVQAVAAGRVYFSPAVERLLVAGVVDRVAAATAPDDFWNLTGREREVLQLIAEGRNTRQIARILGIAAATVAAHRTAAMTKLDLHNTAEIVRYAVRTGVVR
jgi:two-component system, NarL family, response regulator NreC